MEPDLMEQGKSAMTPLHITPEAHEKLMEGTKQNPNAIIRIEEKFSGGG